MTPKPVKLAINVYHHNLKYHRAIALQNIYISGCVLCPSAAAEMWYIWASTSILPFKLKTLDQFRPGCLNLKDEDTLAIFFYQFSRSVHHALLPTTIQKASWTLESFGISLIFFYLLIPSMSHSSSSSLLFLLPAFQYSLVSFLWVSMWQYPRWKTLRVVIYSSIKNVGLGGIS